MASNVPPMSPPPPQPPAPPKKGTSPWVWVGVGCGTLILIAIIGVVGTVWWISRNPMQFAVRALIASHPGVELVSVDEGNRSVTIREKKTGKTVTMTLDDIKNGRITFEGDGDKVTLNAGGDGTLTAESADGKTATLGSGGSVRLPSWFPVYPGATMSGSFSASDETTESAGFTFTTSNSVADVVKFYENEFRQAGLTVTVSGPLVAAKDEAAGREALVTVIADGSETRVSGNFKSKK